MSNNRLLYLIGAPGAGKSTLMAKLTGHLAREEQTEPVPHDVLRYRIYGGEDKLDGVPEEVIGAEIGRHREHFGGTDALPASIIEKAIPWIQTVPYPLILGEGARLANKRFLTAAAEAGYTVHLGVVDHENVEEWRTARAELIGKTQDPAWVKGRATATRNLAEHFVKNHQLGVKVYFGSPDRLIADMEYLLG